MSFSTLPPIGGDSPFPSCANCGGRAQVKENVWGKDKEYFIQCESCGMRTPSCDWVSQAQEIWSKRKGK